MTKTAVVIDFIIKWIITIYLGILPLFFLPFLPEYYTSSKWLLTITVALILFFIWSIRIFLTKTILIPQDKSHRSLLYIFTGTLISLIFASNNRLESFINPFGAGTFLSLSIISALGSIYRNSLRRMITIAITLSGFILGLVSIYGFFGIGKIVSKTIPFMADKLWTPTGTSFASIIILTIILIFTIGEIVSAVKNRQDTAIALYGIAGLVILGGLVTSLIGFLPIFASTVMPLGVAWSVLLEVFKQPKAFFIGVGAENYANAFTMAKPPSINMTSIWNIRFAISSSMILQMATTTGFLGLLTVIYFIKTMLISGKLSQDHIWLKISMIVSALALLFGTPDISILVVITALFIIKAIEHPESHKSIEIPNSFNWISIVIISISGIIFISSIYFIYRLTAGEVLFAKSLKKAQANDGTATYNLQLAAIKQNPYLTSYHLSYAQVNASLANSVANTARQNALKDKPFTLTDEDQKLISQLIQQSIEQAKIAINLSPSNTQAWEVLGRIYQNITGIVQNSDVWTIAAYQRSIALDPVNPIARLNLASAYIMRSDYDQARIQLETAVQLKSDLANLHYNLAYVYRQMKNYPAEKLALENTLKLVPVGSDDAKKVEAELDGVKKLIPVEDKVSSSPTSELSGIQNEDKGAQTKNQTPLTTPAITPKAQITPKLNLPQSSTPSSDSPNLPIAP